MKTINLNLTWNYFNNSNIRNRVVIKSILWGLMLTILLIIGFSLILVVDVFSFRLFARILELISEFGYTTAIGVVMYFIIAFVSLFFIVLCMVYFCGKAIVNYHYLKVENLTKVSLEDIEINSKGSKFRLGFKYLVIQFYYFIPLIICVLILGLFKNLLLGENTEVMIEIFFDLFHIVSVLAIILIYYLFFSSLIRPALYNEMLEDGLFSTFNPINISRRISVGRKTYSDLFKILLILNIVLFSVLFVSWLLNTILIGYLIFPFVLGSLILIMTYIEPHIMAQAFHKK